MAQYVFSKGRYRGHSVNDTIPSPVGKYLKRRLDTDTGIEWYSDGLYWVRTGSKPNDAIVTKTANYTATDNDYTILVNATSGSFTITLPASVGRNGKVFRIRRIDNTVNTVTIDGNASETIGGMLTWQLRFLDEFVEIKCDGSNWIIINRTQFDVNAYRRTGTANNRWYVAGQIGNTAFTSLAVTTNLFYAHPIILSKITTLSDIGINVVTGAASSAVKMGVYKDNGNLQPAGLLYDSGELPTATSATFVSAAPASGLKLQPGIYWLVAVFTGTPSIRFVPVAGQIPILGVDNTPATVSAAASYYKGQTYPVGAMPDPYPSAPTISAASQIPAIYARFSE